MLTKGGLPKVDQRIAVSVAYVAALFMNIMDVTIVNVALPTLSRKFHTTPGAVDVVVIGYLVSLAAFIPASGWIGDRFGGKRTLLTAILIFTVASALCAPSRYQCSKTPSSVLFTSRLRWTRAATDAVRPHRSAPAA